MAVVSQLPVCARGDCSGGERVVDKNRKLKDERCTLWFAISQAQKYKVIIQVRLPRPITWGRKAEVNEPP